MRNLGTLVIFCLWSCLAHGQAAAAWQPLSNGRNLDGWRIIDPPAKVAMADSSLVLRMSAHTARHAFVRTARKYRNFIFEVEFSRDLNLDSGILFRSVDAPDTAFSGLFGYMVKIDPQPARRWTGGIFVDYGNGHEWLHTLENNEAGRNAERPGGEWNRLRIEAIGDHIRVWLNEVPTAHILDTRYKKGYLAFKIHFLTQDQAQERMKIAYRNPRIITRKPRKYARSTPLPLQDTRGFSNIRYFR